jgi:hypothetical protein
METNPYLLYEFCYVPDYCADIKYPIVAEDKRRRQLFPFCQDFFGANRTISVVRAKAGTQ